jgi:RNA polymerase sigma factor (sigma-70 family)
MEASSLDAHVLLAEEDDPIHELVARFQHRVRFFARRIERRYGLAFFLRDDLESAGYWGLLKALRNRREGAHARELSAYVSRRIEGAILDEARRALGHLSSHAPLDGLDLEEALTPDHVSAEALPALDREDADPEQAADRRARWRAVEASLEGLEEGQRQLLLHFATGHSLTEIARSLGSSPARLQGQLGRAARQVRARAPELRRILRQEV